MYPFFSFWNIRFYFFGIFLLISLIVFFYCLIIFSQKKGVTKPIFSDIFSFTLSIFFFSRLFFIINSWRDTKFIFVDLFTGESGLTTFLYQFFIAHDYNLSFVGGIIGFLIVFLIKTRGKQFFKYLDIILPAFLIAGIFTYIGSIFGGQVYGIPFESIISWDYNTKFGQVPLRTNLFPLPLLYILGFLVLIFIGFRLNKINTPDGYTGSLLLGGFGILLFVADFLNGRESILDTSFLHFNQIIGILFVVIAFVWISKTSRS